MFSLRSQAGETQEISLDLNAMLGKGATASVYPATVNGKIYAAKIIHPDRKLDSLKIRAMINNPPDQCFIIKNGIEYPQLAWPIEIIINNNGKEVGFLLPFVDKSESYSLDHYYDLGLIDKLESHSESALSFKLEIARNLSKTVALLNQQGHYFIDLKPQNIQVFKQHHVVTLIDCDGFSIRQGNNRYPAEMLSTDYIAPEAQRELTSPRELGEEQDQYALAVILFQLLNRGTHPFQGILQDSTILLNTNDEKAAAGLYPHGVISHKSIVPRIQSVHHTWDAKTRSMFDRAFLSSTITTRPRANEWEQHFSNLLNTKSLVQCKKFPGDLEHIQFRGMHCATCYLNDLIEKPLLNNRAKQRTKRLDDARKNASGAKQIQPSIPTSNGQGSWIWWILGGVASYFLLVVFNNTPDEIRDKPNAAIYASEYKDGSGTYTYDSGSVYVGEWKDYQRNGQGTLTFGPGDFEGSVYVGEWKDDQRNGQGTFTFGPGDFEAEVFVGEWKDDLANGRGTMTYASGDIFEGEYKDGLRNGPGTMAYASGDIFEGKYKDDLANGRGTMTYASGDIFEGEYKDGLRNGQATLTLAGGRILEAEYKDGELIYSPVISPPLLIPQSYEELLNLKKDFNWNSWSSSTLELIQSGLAATTRMELALEGSTNILPASFYNLSDDVADSMEFVQAWFVDESDLYVMVHNPSDVPIEGLELSHSFSQCGSYEKADTIWQTKFYEPLDQNKTAIYKASLGPFPYSLFSDAETSSCMIIEKAYSSR